jgi:hypothetical protein
MFSKKCHICADYHWLDATDMGRGAGQFFWADNRRVERTWWDVDEPDEHGDGEATCVSLGNGKLLDFWCSRTAPFVCKVGQDNLHCMS